MSWDGNYWGDAGVIECAEQEFASDKLHFMKLASVHYSASGRAFVELKQALWRLQLHKAAAYFVRLVRSAARARHLADGFDTEENLQSYRNNRELCDHLDIFCAIQWRLGRFSLYRRRRMRQVLRRLYWESADERYDVEKHTRFFLIAHWVRLGGCSASVVEDRLYNLAHDIDDSQQQCRAMRVMCKFYGKEEYARRAAELAGPDQRAKLGT